VEMIRLILIRHGLTDDNLKKRYCGFLDTGLNKTGRAQVKEIKSKFKGLKIDKVFCSDLKRSWQTARIIFGKRCEIVKKASLREIDFGIWEGLNFQQISKKFSCIYKKWLKDPFSINIPLGEKTDHFMNRIKEELKNILKKDKNKTVAIVTHSGVTRVILNACLGIKKDNFWKLEIEPQAVYVIEYNTLLRPKIYKL
jgi:alpha-ribazole phosphatase